jgi:hypothetical protein
MVQLEYVGGNAGDMQWVGAASGTMYVFGGSHRRNWVNAADVTNFLNLREGGQVAFRIVPEETLPAGIAEPPVRRSKKGVG